jgi:hypothetical protein
MPSRPTVVRGVTKMLHPAGSDAALRALDWSFARRYSKPAFRYVFSKVAFRIVRLRAPSLTGASWS